MGQKTAGMRRKVTEEGGAEINAVLQGLVG